MPFLGVGVGVSLQKQTLQDAIWSPEQLTTAQMPFAFEFDRDETLTVDNDNNILAVADIRDESIVASPTSISTAPKLVNSALEMVAYDDLALNAPVLLKNTTALIAVIDSVDGNNFVIGDAPSGNSNRLSGDAPYNGNITFDAAFYADATNPTRVSIANTIRKYIYVGAIKNGVSYLYINGELRGQKTHGQTLSKTFTNLFISPADGAIIHAEYVLNYEFTDADIQKFTSYLANRYNMNDLLPDNYSTL